MTDAKKEGSSTEKTSGLKLFEDCYATFVKEHDEAKVEMTKKILSAQHEFRMSRVGSGRSENSETAASRYVDAVQAAWRESQKATKSAHARCVDGLRDAWKRTSLDHMDPKGLCAIANGLATIACYSAAASGNLNVFAATGVTPPEDALFAASAAGDAAS
jgi:hypothetical protein